MRKKRPNWVKKIASEFVSRMLNLAEEVYKDDPKLGKRYIELALKASKKYNIRLPREQKMRICKKCHALMIPGFNTDVRVTKDAVIWICGECGHVKRFRRSKEDSKGDETSSKSWQDGRNRIVASRNK